MQSILFAEGCSIYTGHLCNTPTLKVKCDSTGQQNWLTGTNEYGRLQAVQGLFWPVQAHEKHYHEGRTCSNTESPFKFRNDLCERRDSSVGTEFSSSNSAESYEVMHLYYTAKTVVWGSYYKRYDDFSVYTGHTKNGMIFIPQLGYDIHTRNGMTFILLRVWCSYCLWYGFHTAYGMAFILLTVWLSYCLWYEYLV